MNTNSTAALLTGKLPTIQNDSTVDMGNIRDEWRKSKNFVEQHTKDFPQLDTLVDGVALKRDEKNPFVGDVTLPGLVRQIPRDSLEQLPVFSTTVNGAKNSIPAILCNFMLKKFVFNESTFGKGLLSTLQIGAEEALTHGFSTFICTTGTMYSDFGTTLKNIHYDDLGVEPGITDGNEQGFSYVVANLTRSRVQKILRKAKENPNTSWNPIALQRVLDTDPRTRNYSQFLPVTRRYSSSEAEGPTYQFITRKETGPGAVDITFCPDIEDVPLRVLNSRSKFGYPKVLMLVIDPAQLSPFGISRVRLASPMQNLMNIYLGNIASMLLLNSKPPIFKRGRFTKPVQLKQNAVWETLDQNAQAELKSMDNGALKEFISIANWISTQIAIIMGRNPIAQEHLSKTSQGRKGQDDTEDSSTNQITKILENFLRQYALSGLDTLLSEQEGEEDLIVDDETMNSINQIHEQDYLAAGGDPTAYQPMVNDDHKVPMNWERFYGAIEDWSVEIDVSVSKDEMEEKKRADAQDMLTVLAQNAKDLGPQTQAKVEQIADMLMQDLTPTIKPSPANAGQPQAQAATPGAGQAAVGGQVHETGDLVKMFGMTTDAVLRNAILAAMNLPQVAKALPDELVNPVNPIAQTSLNAQGGYGGPPAPKPAITLAPTGPATSLTR